MINNVINSIIPQRMLALLICTIWGGIAIGQETYAEKLGYPKDAKVIILHVDDAGMSWDSNEGTINAVDHGVASSFSVMMPCPWVPAIVKYIKANPTVDAGLHLTLTSEWKNYRWGPLMGKPSVPGLVDEEGAMWHSVEQVIQHSSGDEVEAEIRAQIERALTMGFKPTHLDSHMGTLFADEEFLKRYIKVGAEYQIPIMFPGGHNSILQEEYRLRAKGELIKSGKWKEGMDVPVPEVLNKAPMIGAQVWSLGLPVMDDLHNMSYGWGFPKDREQTEKNIQAFYTDKFIQTFELLQPGLTMVLMHCTEPSDIFGEISNSGLRRQGDMLAMMDEKLRSYLESEGIIVTTYRDVMERRKKVK